MSTLTTTESNESKKVYSIKNEPVDGIRNWSHFLLLWENAETREIKKSLIFYGLEVPVGGNLPSEKKYDEIDRIIFYLQIADGWTSASKFIAKNDREHLIINKDGRRERKTSDELRQMLAQMAFDMLCAKIFKPAIKNAKEAWKEFRFWSEYIISDRLLSSIKEFFRTEIDNTSSRERVEIDNLYFWKESKSSRKILAKNFLVQLVEVIWDLQEVEIKSYWDEERIEKYRKWNHDTRTLLDSSRPWTVEILVALNRLDVLRKRILRLDQTSLDKLKEIALGNELSEHSNPVSAVRQVPSLDEACYVGSPSAWFVKEHELKTSEHERLEKILETEEQISSAKESLKKLACVEK